MASDDNSDKPVTHDRERRKKMRRLGRERRDQVRWDLNNPIRRKSPGRRALDRLLQALDLIKK